MESARRWVGVGAKATARPVLPPTSRLAPSKPISSAAAAANTLPERHDACEPSALADPERHVAAEHSDDSAQLIATLPPARYATVSARRLRALAS